MALFELVRMAREMLAEVDVTSPRHRASAFVLAASLLLTSAGSLLAAETHVACVARHHGCGQTPTIAQCCCGDQGSASSQSGPVVPRVDVSASPTVAWVAPLQTTIHVAPDAGVPVQTSPTRGAPPDFPILFGSFLI
ncbi:MAG: hypothetical protein A3G27_06565 [Betaproteobacteria bacterium RIFCSPLOWO2_12_FULL_66_14]|nr:MAG: hypothetical protein A3G27_06565 [Betaproteobacteria bacterium RIFCSPLOWO2_12_FULL_66_14]